MNDLVCWHCGANIGDEPLPLSRSAMCAACRRDLRCCRMCLHYDAKLVHACREDRADPPRDKDRANFCEYFKPRDQAHVHPDRTPAEQAQASLEALFGGGSGNTGAGKDSDPGLLFDIPDPDS